ncbi:hypothetical protein [Lysinibacillus sp. NPDC086135]|uniref:hypothetical protein n=1 Tax=Lysinibacillus sp. NPDC086135 TaxID=3364130 RepID=UPI00382D088B
MKANVQIKEALQVISTTLNEAQFLLAFDIVRKPNRLELNVVTEEKEVEFTCVDPLKMKNFLIKLKNITPYHQDDIDELLSEIVY